jgi:hypothetical protein
MTKKLPAIIPADEGLVLLVSNSVVPVFASVDVGGVTTSSGFEGTVGVLVVVGATRKTQAPTSVEKTQVSLGKHSDGPIKTHPLLLVVVEVSFSVVLVGSSVLVELIFMLVVELTVVEVVVVSSVVVNSGFKTHV